MVTIAKIAFRNLNRQKKRSFLLGGAIAFGILIVTVINGFAGSFQANIAGNMAQLFAGHVFVEGVELKEPGVKGKFVEIVRDDAAILAALKDAGIDSTYVAKRSAANVTLSFEGKKAMQNVYGADLANERYLRERVLLKQGDWDNMDDPRALILSEGVAKRLKLEVGDRVTAQLKTVTGQFNVGDFTLAGVSQDMGLFSSMLAYAHRDYLNTLIDIQPHEYQLFGVLVPDLAKAEATAAALTTALKGHAPVFELAAGSKVAPGTSRYQSVAKLAKKEVWEGTKFRVFTINDLISQVEQLVGVLNVTSAVILLVLFLIIMVGISNTFRMVMFERIKEIGTMRAVGTQRGQVRSLFLFEAVFLAAGGAVAGWALAALVMAILSLFDFGTGTVFALFLKNGHLSFSIQAAASAAHFALVLALTLVAAFLPARRAARLAPAVALRSSK